MPHAGSGPARRGTGPIRIILSLFALLLAAASLAAPHAAGAASIEVAHRGGVTTLPGQPLHVLVFDPAALDTLDALGVPVTGVPGANLPDYLGRYRDERYLKIGTLFEPDFEAVAAAAPDLIIVGSRSATHRAALAEIAPTIDLSLDDRHFLAGTKDNLALLGRVFGKEAEAAALRQRLDVATERVRALAPQAGRVLIVMVNGGKLSAYGPGSRFGWLYDDLGVTPAVADMAAATHGEVISFEFILKINPDWLLVLDRDAAVGHGTDAGRAVMDNDIIAASRAHQAGQILYLDPQRWYITGGGGAALSKVAEDVADAFEAKKKP